MGAVIVDDTVLRDPDVQKALQHAFDVIARTAVRVHDQDPDVVPHAYLIECRDEFQGAAESTLLYAAMPTSAEWLLHEAAEALRNGRRVA